MQIFYFVDAAVESRSESSGMYEELIVSFGSVNDGYCTKSFGFFKIPIFFVFVDRSIVSIKISSFYFKKKQKKHQLVYRCKREPREKSSI